MVRGIEATLETLPGKQKLIRLADRPPNYEAPIETFRSAVTPADQFFVRYHLDAIPPMADLGKWSLTVGGEAAERQITLNLDDLQKSFQQQEVTAVCQCSGSTPGPVANAHVASLESGYGAIGSAGLARAAVEGRLAKAGVKPAAIEVWLDGADNQVLAPTPDYRKSLPMDKAGWRTR